MLRAIRERSGVIGNLVAGLFGLAWSLATFLVVPVLVVQGGSPIGVVKRSAALLKRTWGEQIAGNVGLGLAFFVVYMALLFLGIACMVIAGTTGSAALVVFVVIALVLAFMLTGLVHSALSGIYAAALYRFANGDTSGSGFAPQLLEQAFRAK